ncbi:MAG: DUF1104 domain-containing protein [Pseudomonadota bacterium]|nr:DUF1104 domain-containing protein [Pseudomonadota bacterium]
MKRCLMLIMAIAMAMTFSLPVLAADYSSYSTEELAEMRGTMSSSTEEERQSFRNEWQQRVKSMPVDERRQYSGRPANASGNGQGYRHGYGSGSESQNHMGERKGNGQGYGRQRK